MADEYELPKAVVHRIIKSALPDNVQVSKEAKLALQRAATTYIHYITAAANECCQENNRSTISQGDVQQALADINLDEFEEVLTQSLAAYKLECSKKKTPKTTEAPTAPATDATA